MNNMRRDLYYLSIYFLVLGGRIRFVSWGLVGRCSVGSWSISRGSIVGGRSLVDWSLVSWVIFGVFGLSFEFHVSNKSAVRVRSVSNGLTATIGEIDVVRTAD